MNWVEPSNADTSMGAIGGMFFNVDNPTLTICKKMRTLCEIKRAVGLMGFSSYFKA